MNLATHIEHQLDALFSRRRRAVLAGLNTVARELLRQSLIAEDLDKVEAASRAATDTIEILMRAPSRQLERMAELRAETAAAEMDLEGLEASGRLQVLALYRAVEEESLSVSELAAAGISRQRLQQLRDQDRLLGIQLPFRRGFLYPRWQFGEDLRPRDFLPEILAVAHEQGLDALTVHRVMTNPAAGGGVSPLELCEQGQSGQAINALRTLGELGG